MDPTCFGQYPPESAVLRPTMIAQLEYAASLAQTTKNGRCQQMSTSWRGERTAPCSSNPGVERQRKACAIRHELDTTVESELGMVDGPMSQYGMWRGYGYTNSMRTALPSDTAKHAPTMSQKSSIPMPQDPRLANDTRDVPEPPVLVIQPVPPCRKRTRSRSRSRSLERKRITQQPKSVVDETQMSSSTDDRIPHTAATTRNIARTPPPLALPQQQLQPRSRCPSPNLLGSPISQMPPSRIYSTGKTEPTDAISRSYQGPAWSHSAAARVPQQGTLGKEHPILISPPRINTHAAISRPNTPSPGSATGNLIDLNVTGGPTGNRDAARQTMLKRISSRVDMGRDGDRDQASGVKDKIHSNGRATPFEGRPATPGTVGMRPPTPEGGIRSNAPSRQQSPMSRGGEGIQTPAGGISSAPGTSTQGTGGRKRARRRRRCQPDDRGDQTSAPPPQSLLTDRARAASVASGKTDGAHSQERLHLTEQAPRVRPLAMPLTSHPRGCAFLAPPALAVDPYPVDNKIRALSGIQNLEVEREHKSWEGAQSITGKSTKCLERRSTNGVNTHPSANGYASDITSDIDLSSLEGHSFAKGAFGDVRRAFMRDGRRVAIKFLHSYTSAQDAGKQKLEKKLWKEIHVWSYLEHENVLPLLGLCEVNNEFGMVSEFMPNGNVKEYIRCNPTVDRYWLAMNVCAGLAYLHEHTKHIVHGDLKAVNVVVDSNGIPKLMDFGLAQMIQAEGSNNPSSSSSLAGGTSRWMAYELIVSNDVYCKPTLASDVYALGMTIYEMFTGLYPFARKNDPQVILAILQHKLPERVPNAFTEGLWELLHHCWRPDPCKRPTARKVLVTLQDLRRIQGDFTNNVRA